MAITNLKKNTRSPNQKNKHLITFLNRLLRYGPLLVMLSSIIYASGDHMSSPHTSRFIQPLLKWLFPYATQETIEILHIGIRKLAHFTEYALLGFFIARAFRTSTKVWLKLFWFRWGSGSIVVFAFLDEYHQSFVPSRMSSVFDSLIDILGGLSMLFFIRWYQNRSREKT